MQVSKVIKAHGYTIQEAADKLGVARGTLAQSIASTANPTINTLRKVADAVGANLTEFFADEEGRTEQEKKPTQTQTAALICPHCGEPLSIHID